MVSNLRTHRLFSVFFLIFNIFLISQPSLAKDAIYKPAQHLVYVFNMYQPIPREVEKVIQVRVYAQKPGGYEEYIKSLFPNPINGMKPIPFTDIHRSGGELRVEFDLMENNKVRTYQSDEFLIRIDTDGQLIGLYGNSLKSGRSNLGKWSVGVPLLDPKYANIKQMSKEGKEFRSIDGYSRAYSNSDARELADRRNRSGALIVDYPMNEPLADGILRVQIIEQEKGFYDRYVAALDKPIWVEPYRALSARITARIEGVNQEFTANDVNINVQDGKVIGFSGRSLSAKKRRGRPMQLKLEWGVSIVGNSESTDQRAYISPSGFMPLLQGVAPGYSEVVRQREAQTVRCAPILASS